MARRKRAARPQKARSTVERDELLSRAALGYETADALDRDARGSALVFGRFSVSAHVVDPPPAAPLPPGLAWRWAVVAAGFTVLDTEELGKGHRSILLSEPVTEEQAARFNALFGRMPDGTAR